MIPPAPEWTPGAQEYHSSPGWSSSRLKTFRESPRLAWARYVAEVEPPEKPTPAMILGSAAGVLILQPEQAGRLLWVSAGRRGSKVFATDEADFGSSVLVIDQAESDQASGIAEAITHPRTPMAELAHGLLLGGAGYAEYAFAWLDSSGVYCKVMLDRLRVDLGRPVHAELKTTRDPHPEAFARQFYRLGYHCQAAFYRRGLCQALGLDGVDSYVVAVGSSWPHSVYVAPIVGAGLAAGEQQVEYDLRRLAWCLEDPSGVRWRAPWEEVGEFLRPLPPPYGLERVLTAAPVADEEDEGE